MVKFVVNPSTAEKGWFNIYEPLAGSMMAERGDEMVIKSLL